VCGIPAAAPRQAVEAVDVSERRRQKLCLLEYPASTTPRGRRLKQPTRSPVLNGLRAERAERLYYRFIGKLVDAVVKIRVGREETDAAGRFLPGCGVPYGIGARILSWRSFSFRWDSTGVDYLAQARCRVVRYRRREGRYCDESVLRISAMKPNTA